MASMVLRFNKNILLFDISNLQINLDFIFKPKTTIVHACKYHTPSQGLFDLSWLFLPEHHSHFEAMMPHLLVNYLIHKSTYTHIESLTSRSTQKTNEFRHFKISRNVIFNRYNRTLPNKTKV